MPQLPLRPSDAVTSPELERDDVAIALQTALAPRYILLRPLGRGGMGSVYLAREPLLKRLVAVKVLLPGLVADPEARARFQREAQAVAAISHPNVVAIYNIGELTDGTPYFVMQHVPGRSMAERLVDDGPLPIDAARRVLSETAGALAAAHRRGIVHRDVKPANVLWDEEADRAVVTDFGISALNASDTEADVRLTRAGMTLGTPRYMSPEQLVDEAVSDRTDVYALGLLGYELLTADGPYKATSPSDYVAAHLRDTPRSLSASRPDVPPELESLLLRCLAKRATDRPTADDVARQLTPSASELLEWPPPGLERVQRELRRLAVSLLAGTVLLTIPLTLVAGLPKSSDWREMLPPTAVFAALCLLGLAAFVRGAVLLARVGRHLIAAARGGYGAFTLLEVFADVRGDTGALIAGTGHYVLFGPDQRARLRFARVALALAAVGGPTLALLGLFVGLAAGVQGWGTSTFLLGAVVAPLFVAIMVTLIALVAEWRLFAPVHRRRARVGRRSVLPDATVPSWLASFERARLGQQLGRGLLLSPWVFRTVFVTVLAVLLVASAAAYVVSVFAAFGEVAFAIAVPHFKNMTSKARVVRGAAAFRLPPGDVTPLAAGEALVALSHFRLNGSRDSASTHSALSRPPVRRYDSSWTAPTDDPRKLFDSVNARDGEAEAAAAVRAAARGLTAVQRDYLTRWAAHPARGELAVASQARFADVAGALWVQPFPPGTHPGHLPILRFRSVREAAKAHLAAAALAVADARPAEAERLAREVLTVGTQLQDGATLIDNIVGILLMRQGAEVLEEVYMTSDRPEEARRLLASMLDGAKRSEGELRDMSATAVFALARDENALRGIRTEMMLFASFSSCTDAHQMIFGMDPEFRRTATLLRDKLARSPGERAAVDLMLRAAEQPADGVSGLQQASPLVLTLARGLDFVFGTKRFESCASFVSPVAQMI